MMVSGRGSSTVSKTSNMVCNLTVHFPMHCKTLVIKLLGKASSSICGQAIILRDFLLLSLQSASRMIAASGNQPWMLDIHFAYADKTVNYIRSMLYVQPSLWCLRQV